MTDQTPTTDIATVPIDDLIRHPDNPRQGDVGAISASIEVNGWYGTVVAQSSTGRVLAGNHRIEAARHLGMTEVPVYWVDVDDATARRIMLADNRTNDLATYDDAVLAELLTAVAEDDDLLGSGYDGDDLDDLLAAIAGDRDEPVTSVPLHERFLVPPFSVLDTRQGYWQDRKRAWNSLGMKSELGRSDALMFSRPRDEITVRTVEIVEGDETWQQVRAAYRDAFDRSPLTGTRIDEHCGTTGVHGHWYGDSQPAIPTPHQWQRLSEVLDLDSDLWDVMTRTTTRPAAADVTKRLYAINEGTSIFDPVLTELLVRWFSPEGGSVLDPFAGGVVRGAVAARLGRRYTGIDLSDLQVAANRDQAHLWADPDHPDPRWIHADARDVATAADAAPYQFVMTCPPYANREVYSDDPADLSNLPPEDFMGVLAEVIESTVPLMADGSFMAIVISEVRNSKRSGGPYLGLVPGTAQAMTDAGLAYYNELVLVNAIGTLQLRAGRQMAASRKVGRTHQNILVAYKGDLADIPPLDAQAIGDIDAAVAQNDWSDQ